MEKPASFAEKHFKRQLNNVLTGAHTSQGHVGWNPRPKTRNVPQSVRADSATRPGTRHRPSCRPSGTARGAPGWRAPRSRMTGRPRRGREGSLSLALVQSGRDDSEPSTGEVLAQEVNEYAYALVFQERRRAGVEGGFTLHVRS